MNTRLIDHQSLIIGVPEPHPCSLRTQNIPQDKIEEDYQQLSNCCQRHVCRLDGYCKSKKFSKNCRFGYPFKLEEATRLEFIETENTVKASILLKRNDEYMNMHNRLICHLWRANVDMQMILDKHAAVTYMVKYATKGEKAGTNITKLYKDVIGASTDEDNPQSKLRSVMLKSIAGKRDLGQCEVSRLLLSEPLYHSSFNYVTINTDLDSREVNLDKDADSDDLATKKSIIDYYAERKTISEIQHLLHDSINLIDFIKIFNIKKNKLILRENSQKCVVITYPRVLIPSLCFQLI